MKQLLYLPIVFLFCFSMTLFAQRPERINYTSGDGIANAIIPDFQVNENAVPNGAGQEYPSISADSSGNFVMTWVDWRNGDADIYAQRYSSNDSALGTNFKVNDDQGCADQEPPSISTDGSGNFVITWKELDDAERADIYVQRYASDGTALGLNFKVNNVQGSVFPWRHSISTNSSGNFVITWMDDRYGEVDSDGYDICDIYAQRYLSDGSALGDNFKVNDDQGSAEQNHPSISTGSNGNFVITWGDWRNGRRIYAQRYSSDGSKIGNNFNVIDGQVGGFWQRFPFISTNSSGNFIITWHDQDGDVYAQYYSSDGSALGDNFKINDDQGNAYQGDPSIFTDGSGNFVITWTDERNGDNEYDIYAQRYSSDGAVIGTNFKINFELESVYGRIYENRSFSISVDGSSNFVITWANERNGDIDLYAQRYSSDGSASGPEFKINDDHASAHQESSSISTDNSGNFVITWADSRNEYGDIYAQRFSYDGSALGENFQVNDDQGGSKSFLFVPPLPPSISTDGSGNFVITWVDWRNGDRNIYAQRYSSDGTTSGTNFQVTDDQELVASLASPSISTDSSGNFVITWEDWRNGRSIYAQRYSSGGTALENNFKVNDDQGIAGGGFPSISSDGNGNFVITWRDRRNGDGDIYAQRYSSDGTTSGTNFQVTDDQEGADQEFPSISADGSGNFVITWVDDRNGDSDIYAQRYSSGGVAVGDNFIVNDDQESNDQRSPSISVDSSSNFVITWTDERNGNDDIYAQRYSKDGSAVGNNFRVTNTGHKRQSSPDVKLCNNRIYTTWVDNRAGGTGYDIWANVLDWENPATGISNKEQSQSPSAFMLSQNYPNPFNASTKISYSIPKPGFVNLTIYDLLGKEVKTLVSEFQKAALHSVNFEASELTSGIYFYKLQVGGDFVETKRMLLIK